MCNANRGRQEDRETLLGLQKKKVDKKKTEVELREEAHILAEREFIDLELINEKRPRVVGPLDTVVASGKLMIVAPCGVMLKALLLMPFIVKNLSYSASGLGTMSWVQGAEPIPI